MPLVVLALLGVLVGELCVLHVVEARRHARAMERPRAADRENLERHHAAVMALYAPPVEVADTRRALVSGYEAGRVMFGRRAASPPPGYGTVTIPYYDEKRASTDAAGREMLEDAAFLRSLGIEP